MSVVDTLASVLGAAGVAAVLLAAAAHGRWRFGLGMAMDLWLAAGLLRLTGDITWTGIAAAAAIVVLRRALGPGLVGDGAPSPVRSRRAP